MTKIATTYGGALYDLAVSEGLTERILNELQLVLRVWTENPDYEKLLSIPSLPKKEREQLLDEAWKSLLHPYTLNFMKLLCENGTLSQLSGCEKEYRRRYNTDNGILEVCAVVAVQMSKALTDKLSAKITALTGKKVELRVKVDPSVLGGVRLELPDKQLDGSVQYHLEEIQRVLKNTVL